MTEVPLRHLGFSGPILDSTSSGFQAALKRASASSERKAALVAFPNSAKDVSIAITYAIQSKLEVAVKCGGHHYSSANSVENGLVIDMGQMKGILISKESNKVFVDGGCLWGEVYAALHKENLVCVGGGVHVVGVGGHITGGGYGPMSFKYGMACDNVLEATVVVADGRILTASESENQDLFFAIRGGSSSFGVVTQFVLRTYPAQGPYFFRSLGFSANDRLKLFSELRAFLDRVPRARGILGFLNFVQGPPPEHNPALVMNFFGLGSIDEFKDVFGPFLGIAEPWLDRTIDCPSLVEFSHVIDDLLLLGAPRKANGGAPITNLWPGMPEEIWGAWLRYIDANSDARDTKIFLEFHNSIRLRPETTSIPVMVPHHGMCVSSEEHHSPAGDDRARAWTHEICTIARSYETKYGGKDLGINGNASMLTEKSEDVWGLNYPQLRKIKAKYDPNRVFNRYFKIEPDFGKASL